jgi:cytochrome P450
MEFDPLSADFFDDPYDTYRWLRDEAPVYCNERYGFWALSRFADVVAAHRDWQTFSSEHGLSIDQLTDPSQSMKHTSIIMMDPPVHDRMRKLVSRVFTPRAMAALEPMVRDVIVSYLERYDDADSFDAVADFAAPFPVEVISTMLGVPKDHRQQIRHWTDAMLHREPGDPRPTREGMEGGMAQIAFFLELIAEKRAHPADDMLSRLTEVEVEIPVSEGGDGSTHRRRRSRRSRRCCGTGRRRSTRGASPIGPRRSTTSRSPRAHRCSS